MATQVDITLSGPLDHLRLVWQVGENLLESVPFAEDPEGTRYNILLAVQEMLTNVLRHSYAPNDPRPVCVGFRVSDNSVEITLRDKGSEFNPLRFENHRIEEAGQLESLPTAVGGYGIHIARMVMDEVSYERQGDWNHLAMTKRCAQLAATLR